MQLYTLISASELRASAGQVRMVQVSLHNKNNNASTSRHRMQRLVRIVTILLAIMVVISNVAFNTGLHYAEEVRRAAAVVAQGQYTNTDLVSCTTVNHCIDSNALPLPWTNLC
jgi:hypothetical protein